MLPSDFAYGAAVMVAAVAAALDLRAGRVPNGLTLPVVVAAPLVHGVAGGVSALISSMAGLLICAAVPYVLFRRSVMGGGDVKLFAAVGAILGPFRGIEVELLALLVGAMLAVIVPRTRRTLLADPAASTFWRRRVLLGPPVLAATLVTWALPQPLMELLR